MRITNDRIIYTCGKCGWRTAIQAAWADQKPKWCMNRKCRVSFRLKPELLQVTPPTQSQPVKKVEVKSERAAQPKIKRRYAKKGQSPEHKE